MNEKSSVNSNQLIVHRVSGMSMLPLIPENAQVVIKSNCKSLRIGDLVSFSNSEGEKCLHRIVRMGRDRVQTKGDHSVFLDHPIDCDRIDGIAVCYRDLSGKFWKCRPTSAPKMPLVKRCVRKIIYGLLKSERIRLSRLSRKQLTKLGFRQNIAMKMKAKRFEVQKLGKDLMVYDHETDHLHTLNETAALIWELSQDNKSENEIVVHFCNEFEISDQQQVVKDVSDTLSELKKLQLFE